MKDKIIKILEAETFNTSDEAGNTYNVVEDCDFGDIAERIIKILPNQSEPIQEHKSAEEIYEYHFGFWYRKEMTLKEAMINAIKEASQFRQEQTISEEEIGYKAEESYKDYSQSQRFSKQFDFIVGYTRGFKTGMGYSKPVKEVSDEEADSFAKTLFDESRDGAIFLRGVKWFRDKINSKTE